jgi:predicted permease
MTGIEIPFSTALVVLGLSHSINKREVKQLVICHLTYLFFLAASLRSALFPLESGVDGLRTVPLNLSRRLSLPALIFTIAMLYLIHSA